MQKKLQSEWRPFMGLLKYFSWTSRNPTNIRIQQWNPNQFSTPSNLLIHSLTKFHKTNNFLLKRTTFGLSKQNINVSYPLPTSTNFSKNQNLQGPISRFPWKNQNLQWVLKKYSISRPQFYLLEKKCEPTSIFTMKNQILSSPSPNLQDL